MLVGKTGHGKSCTGNTLSKSSTFETSNDFDSVTVEVARADYTADSQQYRAIDTPGTFDTKLSFSELCGRLAGVTHTAPNGLDAVMCIVRKGRMTDEELRALEILSTLLGSNVWNYVVLVFTHCSDVLQDLKDRISSLPEHHLLKRACVACSWRIAKIDNKGPDPEEDRKLIHGLLQEVRQQTGVRFDNLAFEHAREVLAEVNDKENLKNQSAAFADERCRLSGCLNSGKMSLEDYQSQLNTLKKQEEKFAKKRRAIELESLQKSFERWDSAKDWAVMTGKVAMGGAVAAGSVGAVGYAARWAFPYTVPLILAYIFAGGSKPAPQRETVVRVDIGNPMANECSIM
jgi:hypothetical protein